MCSVHRANSVDSKLTQMERMMESGAPEPSESTSKLYLAQFPGENPTELEFTTWLDGATCRPVSWRGRPMFWATKATFAVLQLACSAQPSCVRIPSAPGKILNNRQILKVCVWCCVCEVFLRILSKTLVARLTCTISRWRSGSGSVGDGIFVQLSDLSNYMREWCNVSRRAAESHAERSCRSLGKASLLEWAVGSVSGVRQDSRLGVFNLVHVDSCTAKRALFLIPILLSLDVKAARRARPWALSSAKVCL